MTRILAALAISTALAAPALAEDMACSAFNMLDNDGMMAAMEAAKMAPDGMAAEDGMMSGDDAMAAEDGMMSSDGAMASEDGMMSSDDAMASEDGMMGGEDALAALVKACAEHPDMMVSDAMKPMN
ncbi:hypothetical protein SAMN04487972_12711 [Paracoccus halophilus]|uniref:HdeA/HdeB family protein n=2 Tax=Paracoccus halophilus TaxID=376733 RepID=A0A1I0U8J2_9RHOB|nr:hypothetical protein [Paracoccus halophilus]SFA60173.1 hypothetical protein SAMN04487972_12711 [Paracoccus halophilus]